MPRCQLKWNDYQLWKKLIPSNGIVSVKSLISIGMRFRISIVVGILLYEGYVLEKLLDVIAIIDNVLDHYTHVRIRVCILPLT